MSQIKKKWIGNDQVNSTKVLLDNNTALRSKKQDGSEIELLKIDGADAIHIPYAPLLGARGTDPEAIATIGQIADALEGIDLSDLNAQVAALENYAPQAVLYVAKNGNDSNNGSFKKPFLTIKAALAAVTDATPTNRYTIAVAPGSYVEAADFVLKPDIYIIGLGTGSSISISKSDSSNITCAVTATNSRFFAMNVQFVQRVVFNMSAASGARIEGNHLAYNGGYTVNNSGASQAEAWFKNTLVVGTYITSGNVKSRVLNTTFFAGATHGDATQAAAGTYQGVMQMVASQGLGTPEATELKVNGGALYWVNSSFEKVTLDKGTVVDTDPNLMFFTHDGSIPKSYLVSTNLSYRRKLNDIQSLQFIPVDNSKWNVVPSEAKSALDELADRQKTTENLSSSYAKNDLSNLTPNAAGYGFVSKIDMHSNTIENLGNGVGANDAVNKGQLDAVDTAKANTNLGNLTSPTAVNQILTPDVPATRRLGDLNKSWGSVYAVRYGGTGSTLDLGLCTGTAGTNQVTVTNAANLLNGSILNFFVPSTGVKFVIVSFTGNVLTLTGNLPADLTGVQAYALPNVSIRTENEVSATPSGDALVRSGTTVAGKSGNIQVASGASSSGGTTGDINILAGTTSGTRGKVVLDGSEINVSGKQIKNLSNGTIASDAVNKGQLDAVSGSVGAIATGLMWRDPVFLITTDPELRAASEGSTLASVLPMGDDDSPIFTEADIPVGVYVISENGASSKLWKVIDDAGTKKVSAVGFDPMSAGHSFIVANDLIDAPGVDENQAIYNFNGSAMVKLGDIDWSFATGIDLTITYAMAAINAAIAGGDSVEVAIGKLEKQIFDLAARVTINEGDIVTINGQLVVLDGKIDTEISDRDAADVVLNGLIGAEVSRASGEEATLVKLDGSRSMTGDLDLNSHKVTNLTDGSAASDAVNKGQLDAIGDRVSTAEGDIISLGTRVTVLEDATLAYAKEKFVLSSTDITNQYVDLANLVETNSMVAFVDRVAIHEGASDDYTLSVSGSVSRLSFLNDIATAGASALVAGDTIYVTYAYKPNA